MVAKANNLDVELVETSPSSGDPSYKKINPLDKVPTFVGANGFTLTECLAISVYRESCLPRDVRSFLSLFSFFHKMSNIILLVIPGRINYLSPVDHL